MNDLDTALDIMRSRAAYNLSALLSPAHTKAVLSRISELESEVAMCRQTIEDMALGCGEIGHERMGRSSQLNAVANAQVKRS